MLSKLLMKNINVKNGCNAHFFFSLVLFSVIYIHQFCCACLKQLRMKAKEKMNSNIRRSKVRSFTRDKDTCVYTLFGLPVVYNLFEEKDIVFHFWCHIIQVIDSILHNAAAGHVQP
jgi:hypothetical protein